MQRSVRIAYLLFALVSPRVAIGAEAFPHVTISNGPLTATIYVPDARSGFYRSTRFDWSGVVASLKYKGHEYYGPWFSRTDPADAFYDFNYDDSGVVSAPFTAMIGPGEEFNTNRKALGYDEAPVGGTFVKIGVGVLRKPNEPKYDHSKTYEVVNNGTWTVAHTTDSVTFTQQLHDQASGYAYLYTKVIRLAPNKPEMLIQHTLKNLGSKPIIGTAYNHNFWTLDKLAPGPGLVIGFHFTPTTTRPIDAASAEIVNNEFRYKKELSGKDRVSAAIQGFGATPEDYDLRVENRRAGAGVRIRGDRPLTNIALWSIRTVMAVEPYISMDIAPGADFSWTLTYDYYTFAPDSPSEGSAMALSQE
jgi:hypothetical protein